MSDSNKVISTFNKFSQRGWLPGSTGALSLLCNITESSNKIYVTPDQINKKLTTNDLFLLRSLYGSNDIQEPLNAMDEDLALSKWAPSMLEIIKSVESANAVAQVTTKWAVLSARMALDAWRTRADSHPNVVRLSHWELLKDLGGDRELLLPVINYGNSDQLFTQSKSALSFYPKTCAILIRDYGMLVWGKDFDQVEKRIEMLEYVCEMQIYSYTLLSRQSLV